MRSSGQTDLSASRGIVLERLIDVPHLVARMFDLPGGLLVAPNGRSWEESRLTLRADGSLSGTRVRNESHWVPYRYASDASQLSGPAQAFALMYPDSSEGPYATRTQPSGDAASPYSPGNGAPYSPGAVGSWPPSRQSYSGMPDSIWRHTRDDMPVGYFCGDPEAPAALCLIPDVPLAPDVRIVYLVASCERFYLQTVPSVIDQLICEGIEPDRIKVVVNGCASNAHGVLSGRTHPVKVAAAFSTHDAWEYSALYEAPLRWRNQFDYAMLIHDTVQIQPGFRRAVEGVNGHRQWEYLPASPMARCLLGLYSSIFLDRVNPWLGSIHRISKTDGIMVEVAGELLARASTSMAMGGPAEAKEIVYPYNSPVPRVRKQFPGAKVDKFLHAAGSPTSL